MRTQFSYGSLYAIVIASLAMLIGFLACVRPELSMSLVQEGGIIEVLSAAGYLICLVVLFFIADKSSRSAWCVMLLLAALSLRELDFHKRFTTISVTKSKFYFSGDVPVFQKIAAVIAGLLLVSAVVYLIKRHARDFLAAVRNREAYAIGVGLAAALLCVAKSCDGLPRKLSSMGISLSSDAGRFSTAIEETFELGIPVMLFVAILAKATSSSDFSGSPSEALSEPAATARQAA